MKKDGFLILFIKGFLIGFANTIAGLSGGTVAYITGVYEKMISALANLTKEFFKNIWYLIKLGLGMITGVLAGAIILSFIFKYFTFGIICLFAGLLIGSLINDRYKLKMEKEEKKYSKYLGLFFAFIIVIGLAIVAFYVNSSSFDATVRYENIKFTQMLYLVLVLVLATTSMLFPGISGSLVLMLFGCYYQIINAISDLKNFSNYSTPGFLLNEFLIILPMVIGALVSVLFITKPMKYVINKYPKLCTYIITGFVSGSIIAMFIVNFNTISEQFSLLQLLVGILAMFPIGVTLTLLINKIANKNKEQLQ